MNTSDAYTTQLTATADKVVPMMYVIEGGFLFVANMVVFYRMITSKKLKYQKENVVCAACILFDVIFGLTYFVSGTTRMIMFATEEYIPSRTVWECYLSSNVQLFIIITPAAGYVILITAVDRLICVCWPIRYIRTPIEYFYIMIILPYIMDIPTHIISAITSAPFNDKRTVSAYCKLTEGLVNEVFVSMRAIRISCTIICAVLYVPIYYRARKVVLNNTGQAAAQSHSQKKRMMAMTRTIALIISNTLVFFTIPDIITIYDPKIKTFAFYAMNLNKGIFNFLIIVITQKVVRDTVLRRKTTSEVDVAKQRVASIQPWSTQMSRVE